MIEVTCAIIFKDRKVLATRRSSTMPHPLKWEFPGGKLKGSESPGACIKREILEELGVEINPLEVLEPVEHHYDSRSVRLIPVICTITKGFISLSEHQEYRWVGYDELDELDWLGADLGVVEMIRNLLCL
ncbi:MAG: (deoxy)nucleoside triphosphate pyrophosphohydrolase [Bacteroidales bacterium]